MRKQIKLLRVAKLCFILFAFTTSCSKDGVLAEEEKVLDKSEDDTVETPSSESTCPPK